MGDDGSFGSANEDVEIAVQELRSRVGVEPRHRRLGPHLVVVGDRARNHVLSLFGRAAVVACRGGRRERQDQHGNKGGDSRREKSARDEPSEITERIVHRQRLRELPSRIKPICFDTAVCRDRRGPAGSQRQDRPAVDREQRTEDSPSWALRANKRRRSPELHRPAPAIGPDVTA